MHAEEIKKIIESDIPDSQVLIKGDDGVHFEAIIISKEFTAKSMIQQHQRVYKALGSKMGHEIHALSMKTFTPEEWRSIQSEQS